MGAGERTSREKLDSQASHLESDNKEGRTFPEVPDVFKCQNISPVLIECTSDNYVHMCPVHPPSFRGVPEWRLLGGCNGLAHRCHFNPHGLFSPVTGAQAVLATKGHAMNPSKCAALPQA